MKQNETRVLAPHNCPHCDGIVLVEMIATTPEVLGLITQEDIKRAKIDAITQIKELDIPEDTKEEALGWVDNSDTIFVESDIGEIIKNLINDNS